MSRAPVDDPFAEVAARSGVPTDVLAKRLADATGSGARASVRILRRDSNAYSTTFPTEVVTCELNRSSGVRLFCKHFHFDAGHTHRENSSSVYEIDIYRHLLRYSESSLPGFHGAWIDETTGEALLVLEFLENATRLTRSPDHVGALYAAATWLGKFHAFSIAQSGREKLTFVNMPDLDAYADRSRAIVEFFAFDSELRSFVGTVADKIGLVLDVAKEAPDAVIHGDFYPQNVLVSNGLIYPVDWEAASMTLAEMDLAMLVEGSWPADIVERCVLNYIEARGATGIAADMIRRRLDAAQILTNVYWMSLYPEIEIHGVGTRRPPWRVEHMLSAARRLGIVE